MPFLDLKSVLFCPFLNQEASPPFYCCIRDYSGLTCGSTSPTSTYPCVTPHKSSSFHFSLWVTTTFSSPPSTVIKPKLVLPFYMGECKGMALKDRTLTPLIRGYQKGALPN